MGGIDRARLALSATSDLGKAAINLPPSVIYTRAMQHGDSTGVVEWTQVDSMVTITTTAEINGIRRTLEASFRPNRDRSLYTDLIATTANIYFRDNGTDIKRSNVVLSGALRHNGTINAWDPPGVNGSATDEGNGVPSPQVASYLSSWLPTASGPPSYTPGARDLYQFNVPSGGYAHFANGMPGPGGPGGGYGLFSQFKEVELRVSGGGTAIWMLPTGARFEQRVEVTGSSSDVLVIVAGATGDNNSFANTGANVGLWFGGGIHSPQVPIILVSDGAVLIHHYNQNYETNYVGYLSLFARGFLLERQVTGGGSGSETIHLNHPPGQDNAVLNPLYDDGLLPNTLPGRGQDFIPIAGSWREIPQ
jgi:hypothetical protein